jgi:hypothetical protein
MDCSSVAKPTTASSGSCSRESRLLSREDENLIRRLLLRGYTVSMNGQFSVGPEEGMYVVRFLGEDGRETAPHLTRLDAATAAHVFICLKRGHLPGEDEYEERGGGA